METERIVRDYTEVDVGDGMTRLVPFPPIQVFQFEKRPKRDRHSALLNS